MKERPILFSASMVRAILEGRKTMTRRVVKPQPTFMGSTMLYDSWCWVNKKLDAGYCHTSRDAMERLMLPLCPYGQPGDRLWVRETWGETLDTNGLRHSGVWPDRPHKKVKGQDDDVVIYSADGDWNWCDGDGFETEKSFWKPSIHMPRWASRITLEITAVRVERLQDISPEDAIAEGISPSDNGDPHLEDGFNIIAFRQLWESINGPGSWAANPWVWVVEFKHAP